MPSKKAKDIAGLLRAPRKVGVFEKDRQEMMEMLFKVHVVVNEG